MQCMDGTLAIEDSNYTENETNKYILMCSPVAQVWKKAYHVFVMGVHSHALNEEIRPVDLSQHINIQTRGEQLQTCNLQAVRSINKIWRIQITGGRSNKEQVRF